MEKTRKNYLVIIIVFSVMLSISMAENAKGVFVPLFKENFHIDDADIGFLFLLSSLSYMSSTFVAGYLIDMINRKRTMILGAFLLIIGTIILATSKVLAFFYLSFILSNLGMGFMALSVNTLIPNLKVKNTAVLMNLVHFAYGLGATATHKSCGLLLDTGLSYGQIYYILLSLITLVFILMFFAKFKDEHTEKKNEKVEFHGGEKKLILMIALGLGLYISAEIQTGNWIVDYIKTSFTYSENSASNYSSLFFLFFALGRLFGGFVAEKLGYIKSVILSSTIACLLYFAGLILESTGLILLSISGMFFSIVFPVIMLSINEYFNNKLNKASGIIITIASGTNMIMGFVIGYTSKLIGIQSAMYLVPLFLFISTILFVMVGKKGYNLIRKN